MKAAKQPSRQQILVARHMWRQKEDRYPETWELCLEKAVNMSPEGLARLLKEIEKKGDKHVSKNELLI